MSSPYVKNAFANTVAGAVVKNLNKDKVKEIFVPLPPLAEQKRIVAIIEDLLPHIEQYGKAHDELTALNEKFPDAMTQPIAPPSKTERSHFPSAAKTSCTSTVPAREAAAIKADSFLTAGSSFIGALPDLCRRCGGRAPARRG